MLRKEDGRIRIPSNRLYRRREYWEYGPIMPPEQHDLLYVAFFTWSTAPHLDNDLCSPMSIRTRKWR